MITRLLLSSYMSILSDNINIILMLKPECGRCRELPNTGRYEVRWR